MTHFGTSAKYIDAREEDRRWSRARTTRSRTLRTLFSTGSPLAPESFDYVYQCVKDDLCLSSISGGTDIVSLLRARLPDAAGVARRDRSAAASAWRSTSSTTTASRSRRGRARASSSARRRSRRCRSASGTIPDGAKYRAAYFERFPGVWCHGDYVELTAHGGVDHPRPLGRDAQSRRRAHRHRRDLPAGRAAARGRRERSSSARTGRPARSATCASCCSSSSQDGVALDAALIDRIKQHDPRQHDAAPRAGEGRAGRPTSRAPRATRSSSSPCATSCTAVPVKNLEALANPEALEQFRDREELKT